jgi:hypothetical protein
MEHVTVYLPFIVTPTGKYIFYLCHVLAPPTCLAGPNAGASQKVWRRVSRTLLYYRDVKLTSTEITGVGYLLIKRGSIKTSHGVKPIIPDTAVCTSLRIPISR